MSTHNICFQGEIKKKYLHRLVEKMAFSTAMTKWKLILTNLTFATK